MKLITVQQLPALCKGDIIVKYPHYGEPQEIFDKTRTNCIEAYQIRSIHHLNGMIELVMAAAPLSALPGTISRVFIQIRLLAEQKVWWINDEH